MSRRAEIVRRRAETVVLSGPSRAGKTTVCRAVIAATRLRDLTVGGVLSEDATDDRGAGLQIVCDLLSGERRLLARARPGCDVAARPDLREPSGPPDAFELRWEFDPQGVAFGRRALRAAATLGRDVLVVDQIGPLELRREGGWTCAFDLVREGRFDLALLVVNPRFVEELLTRLGRPCRTLSVDRATRDELPAAIVSDYLA